VERENCATPTRVSPCIERNLQCRLRDQQLALPPGTTSLSRGVGYTLGVGTPRLYTRSMPESDQWERKHVSLLHELVLHWEEPSMSPTPLATSTAAMYDELAETSWIYVGSWSTETLHKINNWVGSVERENMCHYYTSQSLHWEEPSMSPTPPATSTAARYDELAEMNWIYVGSWNTETLHKINVWVRLRSSGIR
jgi:hypothetical protein